MGCVYIYTFIQGVYINKGLLELQFYNLEALHMQLEIIRSKFPLDRNRFTLYNCKVVKETFPNRHSGVFAVDEATHASSSPVPLTSSFMPDRYIFRNLAAAPIILYRKWKQKLVV